MTINDQEDVRLLKILPPKEIWDAAQKLMSKSVLQPSFQSWIRPAQLIEYNNGLATIAVCNEFACSMISGKYSDIICKAIEEITHQKVSIRVVVDASISQEAYTGTIASITTETPVAAPVTSEPVFAQHFSQGQINDYRQEQLGTNVSSANRLPESVVFARSNLNPKYSFDTFVVGSHNRFSHSAALAVGARPGQAYNPLFIYGGVGLGKTHIMQAIGHDVLRHTPNATVRYISCEKFTNELINSIRDDRMSDFRKRYRQVDLLLVDDIQFIQGKESTQEEFFHTFNALRDSGRQIVLSSDRPPKAIARLEERLRSRFEWGLIADIQAPDLETRLAILRKKCDVDGVRVDDEVLEYIASIFTTNIRELEGALIRAHAYGNLTGEPLSIATLAGMLQPTQPQKPKVTLTCDRIIETVAAHYRVEPSELRSAKRSQDLALPRHIAMYLAHDMIQMSFPRIGEAFGNRKHTSALYAHSRIKELTAKDPQLAQSVKQITRQLSD
ncbi:MAG: chromosomal replication initiator protein DnaA [Cyanobacteria bacterium SZAS LIN-2]|nr:chromosomal replication initiator protein DnaA [Cyanobacteria bacterium SZAS LIN-3]MBS1998353.1 chromosomal replication initiator protein DnaA [Cyanobacteria bacterium SZAS LIN-2]MBS2007460.1 chromosomal replication initiator protein DnaA [Cyanobacteria bacterium SZAS TMP-1]